jgi:hypothetical protein
MSDNAQLSGEPVGAASSQPIREFKQHVTVTFSGAHQQTKSLPRSSGTVVISAGCRCTHKRYIAITSSRCSWLALRANLNGFAHLLFRQPFRVARPI